MKCCICNEKIEGKGNSPWPFHRAAGKECCDACNVTFVIPHRLDELRTYQEEETNGGDND